jgi:hypothetical protein
VPEAVHGIHAEDDRDVQPRMLHRVRLHGVVLVGPVQAGIAGTPLASGVGRDVGPAGQDRADIVVDEDLLLAHRVGQVEATLAGAIAAGIGYLRRFDLHHLAGLLGQRHPAEQISDPRLDRSGQVKVGRPAWAEAAVVVIADTDARWR